MENETRMFPSLKETLRAHYLPANGFYQLFFEVDGKTKVVEPIYEPNFDCNGAYMRSIVNEVAKKLECYGISSDDIISSIYEECKNCNMKPPKIMY